MQPERKVQILNTVLQSIIFGMIFTLLGQYVGMLEHAKYISTTGGTYTPLFSELSFSAMKFWIPVVVGSFIGFCIVFFIPVVKWGVAAAFKMKAKPGSLWFTVIVGFFVVIIMVPILSILMTILTTIMLVDPSVGEYRATLWQAIVGAVKYLYLFFSSAWLLAVLIALPCEKFARMILKVPVIEYTHE